jgi:Zn-dependent protease with chaperone function
LRRVERVIRPVLELHGHSDKIELFLYQDYFPSAMVWRGCVLVISDALADHLSDDELAGIVAHEMAHAYFMFETTMARKHRDGQARRIVELQCDAVAMLTLKLMGRDAADYVKALHRIRAITKGHVRIDSHPSIGERVQFAQRFIKLLA